MSRRNSRLDKFEGLGNPFYATEQVTPNQEQDLEPDAPCYCCRKLLKLLLIMITTTLGVVCNLMFVFHMLWVLREGQVAEWTIFFSVVFVGLDFLRNSMFVTNATYLMKLLVRGDNRLLQVTNRLAILLLVEIVFGAVHLLAATQPDMPMRSKKNNDESATFAYMALHRYIPILGTTLRSVHIVLIMGLVKLLNLVRSLA